MENRGKNKRAKAEQKEKNPTLVFSDGIDEEDWQSKVEVVIWGWTEGSWGLREERENVGELPEENKFCISTLNHVPNSIDSNDCGVDERLKSNRPGIN